MATGQEEKDFFNTNILSSVKNCLLLKLAHKELEIESMKHMPQHIFLISLFHALI